MYYSKYDWILMIIFEIFCIVILIKVIEWILVKEKKIMIYINDG